MLAKIFSTSFHSDRKKRCLGKWISNLLDTRNNSVVTMYKVDDTSWYDASERKFTFIYMFNYIAVKLPKAQ